MSVSSRTSTTRRDSLAGPASGAGSLPIASVTAASRSGPSRGRGHRGWLRLISPIAVLVLWQILSTTGVVSQQKLPSLTTLWSTAVHLITTNSPTYGTFAPPGRAGRFGTPGGLGALGGFWGLWGFRGFRGFWGSAGPQLVWVTLLSWSG